LRSNVRLDRTERLDLTGSTVPYSLDSDTLEHLGYVLQIGFQRTGTEKVIQDLSHPHAVGAAKNSSGGSQVCIQYKRKNICKGCDGSEFRFITELIVVFVKFPFLN
jgi:hypothetical protein